jgi:hypothetical protein
MSDEIQIAILKQNLHVARAQFAEIEALHQKSAQAVRVAKLALEKVLWGIEPDVLVEGTSGGQNGVIYRTQSVSPRNWGNDRRPWITGFRRKKDGTFETQMVNLFDDWKMHEETPGQDNHKEEVETSEAPVDPTGD